MKKSAADLVAEAQKYYAAHANPAMANKWARYFAEGYDAWGLLDKGNPFFSTQREEWLNEYATLGLNGFLSAGAELCRGGKCEEASISILFLKHYREALDGRALVRLAKRFEGGMRNWAHVDVLCAEVLAPCLAGGLFEIDALASWRESAWKYQRRASVVALIPPPKEPSAIPPLLSYVRRLMRDPEKPVQQAVGWFLREAWKVAPKPVEEFLLEHAATAPRQIVQTATEKMSAAEKARFKKPAKRVR